MENSEKVIGKIENGDFKNLPQKGKKVEKIKKARIQEEGETHQADDEKSGSMATEDAKVEKKSGSKKAKVPVSKAPENKIANFPVKGAINKFGFIGLSIGICNALSLPVNQNPRVKGQLHPKLSRDINIEFCGYDPATKSLQIKIQ